MTQSASDKTWAVVYTEKAIQSPILDRRQKQ